MSATKEAECQLLIVTATHNRSPRPPRPSPTLFCSLIQHGISAESLRYIVGSIDDDDFDRRLVYDVGKHQRLRSRISQRSFLGDDPLFRYDDRALRQKTRRTRQLHSFGTLCKSVGHTLCCLFNF